MAHTSADERKKELAEQLPGKRTRFAAHFHESINSWELCDTAELRLLKSFQEKGVLIVADVDGEELIILKFNGKFLDWS